jgi:hypothetical protein
LAASSRVVLVSTFFSIFLAAMRAILDLSLAREGDLKVGIGIIRSTDRVNIIVV